MGNKLYEKQQFDIFAIISFFQEIYKLFSITFIAFLTATYSDAARILAAIVFPGKSHFMMHRALIIELVARGHEVTFITAFPIGSDLGANYSEILIEPEYNFWADIQEHFQADNLFELTSLSIYGSMKMLEIIGEKTTEHALMQPKVQEIFNQKKTKDVYDLLIVEQFYQDAFLALSYKYDIPIVAVCTLGYENFMSQMMGLITPWSFVPHSFLPFDDKMTFWERFENGLASLYEDYFREYVYFPKQDALVKKYMSHLPMKIPKVSEMEKNISVMLSNTYFPLITPRPFVPGLIPVGGLHIYPPKHLPADIKKFLDEAPHGAIFFSLGSNVQSADMPPEKLKIFLEVFASMKQRILWKFEDEGIVNLPSNVMIKKWLPQSDILAHPNVKVFITHGGLFGSQEGVYHGVPILGIPIYCDQYLNMNKATKAGYAITLSFPTITKDLLKDSLRQLLEEPAYKKNVQKISQIFRDRPLSPMDTAMYWIEYVIRHKGAPQIRTAGLDLAWYEFYLLVVIGLVALIATLLVACIYVMLRFFFVRRKIKQKVN